MAVVADGVLVGVARRAAFSGEGTVEDVMEPPPLVTLTDPVASLIELSDFFEGASVPVVDDEGRLVGAVPAAAGAAGPV